MLALRYEEQAGTYAYVIKPDFDDLLGTINQSVLIIYRRILDSPNAGAQSCLRRNPKPISLFLSNRLNDHFSEQIGNIALLTGVRKPQKIYEAGDAVDVSLERYRKNNFKFT